MKDLRDSSQTEADHLAKAPGSSLSPPGHPSAEASGPPRLTSAAAPPPSQSPREQARGDTAQAPRRDRRSRGAPHAPGPSEGPARAQAEDGDGGHDTTLVGTRRQRALRRLGTG